MTTTEPTVDASPFVIVHGVLTAAECAAVIHAASTAECQPLRGTVGHEYRVQLAWLDRRVADLIAAANVWRLPVRRASLSVLRRPVGSCQARHSDVSEPRGLLRRVSASILVNDGYRGGAMEVVADGHVHTPPLPAGSALVFPATAVHAVRPITAGERWSIVVWAEAR